MTTTIMVTGYKGGSGKTTVARSLVYTAQNAGMDLQILDGSSRLSCPVRRQMRQADYAIVVEEPGIFGRLDLAFALGELRKVKTPCGVLVNKSDLLDDQEMEAFLKEQQVPLLGKLPFNRYTALVLGDGKILSQELNEIDLLFRHILEQIIREVGETQ